jgi:hypothetical protein
MCARCPRAWRSANAQRWCRTSPRYCGPKSDEPLVCGAATTTRSSFWGTSSHVEFLVGLPRPFRGRRASPGMVAAAPAVMAALRWCPDSAPNGTLRPGSIANICAGALETTIRPPRLSAHSSCARLRGVPVARECLSRVSAGLGSVGVEGVSASASCERELQAASRPVGGESTSGLRAARARPPRPAHRVGAARSAELRQG